MEKKYVAIADHLCCLEEEAASRQQLVEAYEAAGVLAKIDHQ